jgi:ubiquinone biosynthesis protein UbiJ
VLDAIASQSVVAWYNRLLRREAWACAALAPHAGATARIDVGLVCIFLAVAPGGMLAVGTGTPSVTITLEPSALAGSLWDPGLALRDVRVAGDAAFAQVLTDVLQKLRPDPAEDMARWIGDAPAERIVKTVTAAMAQLRETAERAARQGADYFVAENPMVLGKQDWESFSQDLTALLARLASLEDRVAVLPTEASARASPSVRGAERGPGA